MINVRPAAARGAANLGWLDSRHTFSFGHYYDPAHMGFGPLRVINEDRVIPAAGFGTHGHQNMEIITWVLEGALEHQDSLGTSGIIRPGEVQKMSAGSGITHSEFNASKTEPVHFLQVWIQPDRSNIAPSYDQKAFPQAERRGRLRLVVSPDGAEGSIRIVQDARMYATLLAAGESVVHDIAPKRRAWVQVARGAITLNGSVLAAGDGAAVEGEPRLRLVGVEDAEALLFDLP
jgi:redox-sensitive bicupin YhaK (pirin superfamily)